MKCGIEWHMIKQFDLLGFNIEEIGDIVHFILFFL